MARDLRSRLDADLFDRLSHLLVTVPPLRACREDLPEDWQRVWRELRMDDSLPATAPWSDALGSVLSSHPLPGNLRDLQRLAQLTAAWTSVSPRHEALTRALAQWERSVEAAPDEPMGHGSRRDRTLAFQRRLALWAKDRYGTWGEAAKALECDEKTLRKDAASQD